eukprot:2397410-Rhodomonas_salina.1
MSDGLTELLLVSCTGLRDRRWEVQSRQLALNTYMGPRMWQCRAGRQNLHTVLPLSAPALQQSLQP